MSNYQKFMLYTSFIASAWSVMIYLNWLPWYSLVLLALFVLLRLVSGAVFIQQNFYLQSINSLSDKNINLLSNQIVLTFDDGIHKTNTPKVLDILSKKNIKANFFLIGKNCEGYSNIIKRMIQEGHGIGNHSYSHDFWFDLKSTNEMVDELRKTNSLLESMGCLVTQCRPPYGVTNPNLAKAFKQIGLQSIGWNLRSFDTKATDKQLLLNKLIKRTKPNSIILLHDRCDITVEVLTDYIDDCLAKGYTFVTV